MALRASIAIIGAIAWLAMFEHNYHPRIYRYKEGATILQVGDSELDFDHLPGASSRTTWMTSCESRTSPGALVGGASLKTERLVRIVGFKNR